MFQQSFLGTRSGPLGLAFLAAVILSACAGDITSPDSDGYEVALTGPTWVACAKQGERCAFTSTRRVRYGTSGRYSVKTFTDGVQCDGPKFGVMSRSSASCQYDSSSNASGSAGGPASAGATAPTAGTGATSAGRGAAGSGNAGAAAPAPGTVNEATTLVISSALRLDRTSVQPGQTLTGTVTYTNKSSAALSFWSIIVAARRPGATHNDGPYDDLAPVQQPKTIAAGESLTVSATRTFSASDATGQWEAYAALQGDDGMWHDGPGVFFAVSAVGTPPVTTPPVVTPPVTPPPVVTPPVTPPPVTTGAMKIGTNFWYHTPNENNWSGETSMKSGINWATAYGSGTNGLAATNVWDDTFISELAPYSTLRFMDWGNTNHSQITSWSQRMLPVNPNNYSVYIDSGSPPENPGMAYEWMIDLGNRTHKDIWITLPAKADANYWTQLATLIKSKLQADRKVYIEYANETWNGSFGQFQYTLDQGTAQGLPGANQWYQGQAYAMWQSVKIFKAFEDVFGASAMGTKVIRVFAYGGNMDTGRQAMNSVYKSSTWNPSNAKIDMLAIAPYVGSGLDGASATIQSDFHHAIDQKEFRFDNGDLGNVAFAVQDLKTFGIPQLGAYEGGQHLLKNSMKWSSNPKIYAEYTYMLDRWSQYFTLFVHYSHTGKWTDAENQSSWGAKDHTGQPLAEAHKYRALLDWANSHP
jgi:hypothetical protein